MIHIVQRATSDELDELMDTLLELDSMSKSQTDLFCAVVDELTIRGNFPKATEEETNEMARRVFDRVTQDDSRELLFFVPTKELWDLLKNVSSDQTELLTAIADEMIKRGAMTTDAIDSDDALEMTRDIIRLGTPKELTHMLKTMYHSNKMLKEQARLLYDVAEELKRNGQPIPYSNNELQSRVEFILHNGRTLDEVMSEMPHATKGSKSSRRLRIRKKPRFTRDDNSKTIKAT